jgi:hypothetical protein
MDTLSALGGVSPGDISKDPSQLSSTFGRISITNSEINYVESAHWTAILDGVCWLAPHDQHRLTRTLDWRAEGLL